MIAPDELQADSAYCDAERRRASPRRCRKREAALRYQQLQTSEQIRQAEAMLASTEAQQAAATADLENAKLTYDRNAESREGRRHVAAGAR